MEVVDHYPPSIFLQVLLVLEIPPSIIVHPYPPSIFPHRLLVLERMPSIVVGLYPPSIFLQVLLVLDMVPSRNVHPYPISIFLQVLLVSKMVSLMVVRFSVFQLLKKIFQLYNFFAIGMMYYKSVIPFYYLFIILHFLILMNLQLKEEE